MIVSRIKRLHNFRFHVGADGSSGTYHQNDRATTIGHLQVSPKSITSLLTSATCAHLISCKDVEFTLGNLVTDVEYHFTSLRYLEVSGCSFKPVGGNDVQQDHFLRLEGLLLVNFEIESLDDMRLRFQTVKYLKISQCKLFKRLSSSEASLPVLEKLSIDKCDKFEEFFSYNQEANQDSVECSLPRLHFISLMGLPKLRILSREGEKWGCLETVQVEDCKHIERLPIGIENSPKIKIIKGEKHWWDNLSWMDDATGDLLALRLSSPDHPTRGKSSLKHTMYLNYQ